MMAGTDAALGLDPGAVEAIVEGRHGDPFAVLGPHDVGNRCFVRTFQPGADAVDVIARDDGAVIARLEIVHPAGLWAGPVEHAGAYRLRIRWGLETRESEDPYSFGLLLGELDLHLISQGTHYRLGHVLGAQAMHVDGVPGVRFAVWAPNARRVSVVGDFDVWDGRRHPMRLRREAGVWELFVPRLLPGARYKYEISGPDGSVLPQKADPVARAAEAAPATASIVADPAPYAWTDHAWMEARAARQTPEAPLSIYEIHAASWARRPDGTILSWSELAERLIPYVAAMGFTHVEFLPIMEHPFGGSWGYQPLGLFAPTGRHGSPEDFARFVDRCHEAGIGVIWTGCPPISRPTSSASPASTAPRSTSTKTRARASTRIGTR